MGQKPVAFKTTVVGFAVQTSQALWVFFIDSETCMSYCRCYNQFQNLDPCFEARYIVNPTYPPKITTKMSTIFMKTHPHPRLWSCPVFPEKGVDAVFLPPLLPLPSVFARSEVSLMCMFHVSTAMMSWLSCNSPVSALKPRCNGGESFSVPVSKQSVHWSTTSYWSSTFRDSSWKYVRRILVGIVAVRRPRACAGSKQILVPDWFSVFERSSIPSSLLIRCPFRHGPCRTEPSHCPTCPSHKETRLRGENSYRYR